MTTDKFRHAKHNKEGFEGYGHREHTFGYVLRLIDQLDEPETLSPDWIDEHQITLKDVWDGKVHKVVPVKELREVIVPKQSKVKVPQFVADWIERFVGSHDLYPALKKLENYSSGWKDVYEWYRKNTFEFVIAYLTRNFEVEEEQKKYILRINGNYIRKLNVETTNFEGIIDQTNIKVTYGGKSKAQPFTKEEKEFIEKQLNVEVEEEVE